MLNLTVQPTEVNHDKIQFTISESGAFWGKFRLST